MFELFNRPFWYHQSRQKYSPTWIFFVQSRSPYSSLDLTMANKIIKNVLFNLTKPNNMDILYSQPNTNECNNDPFKHDILLQRRAWLQCHHGSADAWASSALGRSIPKKIAVCIPPHHRNGLNEADITETQIPVTSKNIDTDSC